jgi:hypothetical protein
MSNMDFIFDTDQAQMNKVGNQYFDHFDRLNQFVTSKYSTYILYFISLTVSYLLQYLREYTTGAYLY